MTLAEQQKDAAAAKTRILEFMPEDKRDEARGLLEQYVSYRLAVVHESYKREREARRQSRGQFGAAGSMAEE